THLALTARVASGHPPRALHDLARSPRRAVDRRPLVDVAAHVVHAERAHAARVRARGRSVVDELAHLAEPLLDVAVARARVALEAVGVGPLLSPSARDLPLARQAQARARALADFLGLRPRLLVHRQIGPRLDALGRVDAEALVNALADALGR